MPGRIFSKLCGASTWRSAHAAIGADGDHVVAAAGGLAVVLEGARAIGLGPDALGLAEAGAHIGLGGQAFFEFLDVLGVAAGQRQHAQHGHGNPQETGN
jgi:hypothetical protein